MTTNAPIALEIERTPVTPIERAYSVCIQYTAALRCHSRGLNSSAPHVGIREFAVRCDMGFPVLDGGVLDLAEEILHIYI